MANKYIFNTKTLAYEKVDHRFRDKMLKAGRYTLTSLFLSFVMLIIAFSIIDSPKEKKLKREIAEIQFQYDLLNHKMVKVEDVLKNMASRDNDIYRVVLDAKPIPESMREAGFGGADRYKELQGFNNSELMIDATRNMDKLIKQMYVQSKSYDDVERMAKNKEKMLACIPAIEPISDKFHTSIVSGFGWRVHPVYKTEKFHEGIDFAAPEGTPIYATGDATVDKADDHEQGYGNHVVLDHGFGFETLYGHMSRIAVVAGERVKRGQIIGYVGCTGLCTGDHVHYEVLKNGERVNPIDYFYNNISPDEYKQIIALSSQPSQSLD